MAAKAASGGLLRHELRSSVNVIGRMVAWGGQPFGAFTGALIGQAVSVRAAYLVAVAMMATSAAVGAVLLAGRGSTTGPR